MHEIEQLLIRLHQFGLLTNDEEEMYPAALLHIECNLREKTEYIKFIEQFNAITKKKYKPDVESRDMFYKDSSIYSLTDRVNAVKNSLNDEWVQQNIGVLQPKWILKPENTAKYMNYEPGKRTIQQNKNQSSNLERKAAV